MVSLAVKGWRSHINKKMEKCGYKFIDLKDVLQSMQPLRCVLSDIFGPTLGKVMMTKQTGEVVITNDGSSIARATISGNPVVR